MTDSKFATVLRVTSGNFIEMFDFFLFGLYADDIARTFSPPGDDASSLLRTYLVFGVGFLMRPLGAIVLGAYIDRVGRRQGLITTLALMALGTALMAFTPGFATIGIMASVLVVFGRLVQGFSAGVELGGVSVYLAEMAPPGQKGFYVSWQSASQQVAVMFGAVLGYAVKQSFDAAQIADWAWRIPFFIGCLIVPVLYYIRRALQETAEFAARAHRPGVREILTSLAASWRIVLLGAMLVVMTTVMFYFITNYAAALGRTLRLSPTETLLITFCVGLSNFVWLPVMGALSDRVGRRPLLLVFSALTLVTAYPALSWLAGHASFGAMLAVLLWLSFLYGSYNGAMVVALTEIVPVHVRTVGFSLAYSLATAVFGGFTDYVSARLTSYTGNPAAPGLWLAFAGACGAVATLLIYRTARAGALRPIAAGD